VTTDGPPRRNFELKAPVADLEAARAIAASLGATDSGTLSQRDTYFSVPQGRLKLREVPGRAAELIFYERPEDAAQRWSEYRISSVDDPAALRAVLAAALGERGVVVKQRQVFLWNGCRIHLDEVENLGTFVELEVVSKGDPANDQERMRALMVAFGLHDKDTIRASYADLLHL
jgi:predicted adenylyl cyclase CyaB